ncbi:MAG: ubiquinol-cytochrome c reductase iron-sulfur subunit [Xanthomonadales bacterium]|jgi:ubiquinol-cytochrome c reductase iron-sulfur subunit|nr:ubiquinol-cytochrome c reductase iron-sulfur subunit [Xanthomonadales bacterium]MDH4018364.1 ubiquinol-cytochrome c reductase iron-sulfur subunit [Xanthomonadales bacterium]
MSSDDVNKGRRRFLVATTTVVGGVGVGFAAVPFIKSWMPSARAQAIGVPVEVNVQKLKEGQLLKVQWRGQTIGVLRRTDEMVTGLSKVDDFLADPESQNAEQPEYINGEPRALNPEFLVVNMHCTHLGCVPQMIPQVGPQPFDANWNGGFYCPCHKSKFDLSGRVFKGVPAPTNLRIPPYSFLDDDTLIIGVSPKGAV